VTLLICRILIFGGQITNTMIEESSNSSDMGPGDTTTDQVSLFGEIDYG